MYGHPMFVIAARAPDAFSLWLGIVVGGVLALMLTMEPWAKKADDDDSRGALGSLLGAWLGAIGPIIAGIIVIAEEMIWP
jgi:hypothetical protein